MAILTRFSTIAVYLGNGAMVTMERYQEVMGAGLNGIIFDDLE